MYGAVLLLHLLAATIWTGGHLVLALAVLPRVLRERAPAELRRFEAGYERIGLPALLVQVVSGLWLAHQRVPEITQWLALDEPAARPIAAKLLLLALTVLIAGHARLRVVPRLSVDTLALMAWHIVAMTVLSVLFVAAGVAFRTGWLY